MLHLKRCNYQCFLWKSATQAKPDIQSPIGNGWIGTEHGVLPELMTQESAPREMAEMATCNCRSTRCSSRLCKCKRYGLNCTQACLCDGDSGKCNNISVETDDSEIEESDSDFDDLIPNANMATHGNEDFQK